MVLFYSGHFRNDESLIKASLLANDRLMVQTSKSAEMDVSPIKDPRLFSWLMNNMTVSKFLQSKCLNMFEILYFHSDTKKQKKQKNKESHPPPSTSDKVEDDKPKCTILPEIPMNPNTNINGTDAKSLKEENFQLKEQRICKVINLAA